jgi:alkanesulfonate monooxygenase SsuD/methylene tetrahydromethanopterin reductase-like flavin-dependent oxidoreductase (luciferase family)
MGVDLKTRARRLEESIGVIRRLWSEDRVTHEGEFYQFADVSLNPKPIQNLPPIWTVSNVNMYTDDPKKLDVPLLRAARLADGWQTASRMPGVLQGSLGRIHHHLRELGRDPAQFDCCVQIIVNVNDDEQAAFDEAKRYLDEYYFADYADQDVRRFGAIGSPEECARVIQQLVDEGANYVTLRLATWQRRAMFDRVEKEVLPLITPRGARNGSGTATAG